MSNDYKLLQTLIQMSSIQNLNFLPDYYTNCLKYMNSREGGIVDHDLRNIQNKLDRTINKQRTL